MTELMKHVVLALISVVVAVSLGLVLSLFFQRLRRIRDEIEAGRDGLET